MLVVYYEIDECYCVLTQVCDSCVMWLVIEKRILKIKWWSDMGCIKLNYVINIFIIYFDYILFICFVNFFCVITYSLCAICVWILWWSQTLCSWEQMTRWMTLKNLVLGDVRTQCSDRMWHWGWVFYFNCIMLFYFILLHWFNKTFFCKLWQSCFEPNMFLISLIW